MLRNKRVLALIMLVFFVFGQVNESKAAVPLAPAIAYVTASLLVCAGVEFLVDEGARAGAAQAWERFSQSLKDKITMAVVTGKIILNPVEWNEVKEAAQEVKNEIVKVYGETYTQQIIQPDGSYNSYGNAPIEFGVVSINTSFYWDDNVRITVGGRPMTFDVVKNLDRLPGGGDYIIEFRWKDIIKFAPGGSRKVPLSATVTANGEYVNVVANGVAVVEGHVESGGFGEIRIYDMSWESENEDMVVDFVWSGIETVEQEEGVTYIINHNYYDNPAWDMANREIAVPTTAEGVVGKTAEDIAEGSAVVSPPGIGEEIGTVTGWLSNIYNGIQNLAGTLQGVATKVASIPMSIAQAISDTVVGEIETVSIEPLVGALSGVTNKFPFSLPWDLKRAIEAVAVPDMGPPEIHTSVTIGGYTCPVDIVIPEQITDMVVYFRWALLILWDVGLIFILATLMRGAS